MLTGKKTILFGAGINGRRGLNFFGYDRVYCFTDNIKAGQTFWGKPIISFDELVGIKEDYNVVLSANVESSASIAKQCEICGVSFSYLDDHISHEDFESNLRIQSFKNKHKGERCFLVGNGPSLSADDLTVLHKNSEIAFGCNAISRIFDDTPWRPNYYLVIDSAFFKFQSEMLAKTEAGFKFFPALIDTNTNVDDMAVMLELFNRVQGQINYFRIVPHCRLDGVMHFSQDISKAVYVHGNVMYVLIQFAVYMGFTEIYLIGVDGGTIGYESQGENTPKGSHFYKEDEQLDKLFNSYITYAKPEIRANIEVNAYMTADEYTRKLGVRILNASRGGKLGVFERVDFDKIYV